MTLLAFQAAAIYALALVLARAGAASRRRAVLVTACAVVAALPLLALAPRWSPPVAVMAAVGALQEPAGSGAATVAPWRPAPALGWVWGVGRGVRAGVGAPGRRSARRAPPVRVRPGPGG